MRKTPATFNLPGKCSSWPRYQGLIHLLELLLNWVSMFQVVYSKTVETEKDNKEAGHRLCETYMVLGEVSLENENYPQVDLASILIILLN